jgi:hypothetical protein
VRRPDSTYPVIVKPYKLDLSQIGETVRDEMKFTIENVSETDLDLSLIDDRKDLFQLELPETIPAGKTAEGILRLTDKGIEEEFEKSFTFSLSDETGTRFTVPIRRKIRVVGGQQTSAPGYGADESKP